MDGNTRLCTATAAAALKESFGSDGQPGSYADLDHADAIFRFGHNIAETQTVLWAGSSTGWPASTRRASCRRPARTRGRAAVPGGASGAEAGTNVALMNGLLHQIIGNGWVDHDYVDAHTTGSTSWRAGAGLPAGGRGRDLRGRGRASRGGGARSSARERLLSTVLQGFYQSHQARGGRRLRSTTCTCCAACSAGPAAASCR